MCRDINTNVLTLHKCPPVKRAKHPPRDKTKKMALTNRDWEKKNQKEKTAAVQGMLMMRTHWSRARTRSRRTPSWMPWCKPPASSWWVTSYMGGSFFLGANVHEFIHVYMFVSLYSLPDPLSRRRRLLRERAWSYLADAHCAPRASANVIVIINNYISMCQHEISSSLRMWTSTSPSLSHHIPHACMPSHPVTSLPS